MTVLELLVVLAIGAVAVTLAAIAIPRAGESRRPAEDLAALLADARLEASATGRAVVVEIAPGAMSYGSRTVRWNSGVTVTLTNGAAGRVVFHGDGSMVGPAIRITGEGEFLLVVSPDRLPSTAS